MMSNISIFVVSLAFLTFMLIEAETPSNNTVTAIGLQNQTENGTQINNDALFKKPSKNKRPVKPPKKKVTKKPSKKPSKKPNIKINNINKVVKPTKIPNIKNNTDKKIKNSNKKPIFDINAIKKIRDSNKKKTKIEINVNNNIVIPEGDSATTTETPEQNEIELVEQAVENPAENKNQTNNTDLFRRF